MPARGLGGGILEGLMYQQQRKDQLDQQAQEMALRNAQMRLNQDEFTRLKNNDVISAKQHEDEYNLRQQEFDWRKQQAGDQTTQKRQGDALDLTNQLLGKGYSGAQAAPLTDALIRGDMPAFNATLQQLTVSPLLEEKNKQAWARLEGTMQGDELRFFRMTRDTLYNSGSVSWDQANHEALAQLQVMRVQNRGAVPQGEAQPAQTESQGQTPDIAKMFQTTGIGVNPRIQSQNQYRDIMSKNAQQKGAFDAAMNPLRLTNQQLEKEKRQLEIQQKKDAIARMKATLPYDMLLKQWQVKRAITSEEIAKFNLDQKKEEAKWRKQMGYGTESQMRVQHQAEGRAAELFKMRSNAQKELYGIEKTMNAYRAVLGSPEPSEQDAKYPELIQQRQIAGETLPGLNVQRQELKQRLEEIKKLEARNNTYRNLNIQRTNNNGKPFGNKPPAITTPQTGNNVLPKITPAPGAPALPKMQLGKVGDQRTKKGKPDFSKMTDAELKAWRPGK